MNKGLIAVVTLITVLFIGLPVLAADVVVTMNHISEQGTGKNIGTVTISESPEGLVFTPRFTDLPPGIHGFHIHQNADCSAAMKEGKSVAGLAAGGHYDPAKMGKHEGPMGNGHLGDLPVLTVGPDGKAEGAVTAPHIKTLAEIKGRSLMIHAGGDNYSDLPAPLGGGGARIACGIIQ